MPLPAARREHFLRMYIDRTVVGFEQLGCHWQVMCGLALRANGAALRVHSLPMMTRMIAVYNTFIYTHYIHSAASTYLYIYKL